MELILDTNGLSAMADGDDALAVLLDTADEIAIPVIVLGEYRYGIRRSRDRATREIWLAKFVSRCRVLVVDQETAGQYAEIRDELQRIGRPIPVNDFWIAALARQHSMAVVSRDRHFDFVAGVKRVGW